ncbi:MAG: type II toxin-antitoxin system death-on-curing family toxin [Chloroflexi bacterium]|nr:type II toxin-antitoxin system death-on-curing family toxin [Chloroflexota bacterium]
MTYLTAEQVLFVHSRLVSEIGGSHGIRDLGLLESAVARPQATFEGKDLYPDIFNKAAALMESLIGNHPFVDGNKRAGISAAVLFLRINGWKLTASNADLEAETLRVVVGDTPVEGLARWLRSNFLPRRPHRRHRRRRGDGSPRLHPGNLSV